MVKYWLQYWDRDQRNRTENPEGSTLWLNNFDNGVKIIQDSKEHYPEKMYSDICMVLWKN